MTKTKNSNQPVKKRRSLLQFQGFSKSTNSSEEVSKLEITCEFCQKKFQHNGAKKSHQLFCAENPNRMATNKDLNEKSESGELITTITSIFDEMIENVCSLTSPGGWRFAKVHKNPSQVYKMFEKREPEKR